MFPVFFVAAILLPSIAALYPFLVIPVLFQPAATANNASQHGNFSVPLGIGCPRLTPRDARPTSVRDLRPDDIRVVMGLGDSVMTGFGAKGIQNGRYISGNTLEEARGVSFAMGGDVGAITLPNIIHYYAPKLYGASVGEQFFTICFGDQFCPLGQYKPEIDQLNAAQSGARSLNLQGHEMDYLLKQLEQAYDKNLIQPDDWKLLTIFIGSNDICHACTTPTSLPIPFTANIHATIERIRTSVRNVLVQIVGLLRVDEIFTQTQAYPEYCQPFPRTSFVLHNYECTCAHTEANRTLIASLVPQYNIALKALAQAYTTNDSFAVIYQPLQPDILSFPIDAISNVDCFHPSEIAHAWFAKELW
ncbi:hypothetical protein BCR43DRAFT_437435 [Syncephalastrum racemosum]|uniref:SGNH hydrolase-type esterase domain-containing protein n=1 Tax=Syncephalastrum racemosum TaxID=13706 RepID=A0A1X2HGY1_SYNRA|nr:hypothetical protein BCR43DRAFT_437435 [Syncephalastrum racemosum]